MTLNAARFVGVLAAAAHLLATTVSHTEIVVTSRYFLRTAASLIGLWIVLAINCLSASAQVRGVEIGGQVDALRLNEFDLTDVGVGVAVMWPLTPVLAIDGALTWFPGANDGEVGTFKSQQRVLGMAGLKRTVVTFGDVEFFARARAGFLRFGEQDSAVCIAIFPAPLGCQLAAGYTAFAADFGGGANVRVAPAGRFVLGLEASDLLVRYELKASRPQGELTDGFIGHNPLVAVGLSWRF